MDASGKIPSGFSDGSLAELGDFDMCLRINVRNQQGETQYRGQYCSLTLDPPLPPKPPIIRNNVPVISTEGFANNSVSTSRFLQAAHKIRDQWANVGTRKAHARARP